LCSLYVPPDEPAAGVTVALAEQYTHLGTLWSGADRQPNPGGQYLDSSTTQLTLVYRPAGPWQFQATLPWIHRRFRRAGHFVFENGAVAGLGDATLAARFAAWQHDDGNQSFTASLLGGIKFATGDSDHLGDELTHAEHHHAGFPDSGVHGHDLALGNGAVDFIYGGDLSWRRGPWLARASLQYKDHRPGSFGYRLADETSWDIAAGRSVTIGGAPVTLQALFTAEHKGLDTLGGDPQDDTGYSIRYFGARITANFRNRINVEAAFEMPVWRRTTALMAAPDYRVRTSFTWRL
jgi:hypothetical protein